MSLAETMSWSPERAALEWAGMARLHCPGVGRAPGREMRRAVRMLVEVGQSACGQAPAETLPQAYFAPPPPEMQTGAFLGPRSLRISGYPVNDVFLDGFCTL